MSEEHKQLQSQLAEAIESRDLWRIKAKDAKAEIERLKEYTIHKTGCLRYAGSTLEDCTCGLEQVLKS